MRSVPKQNSLHQFRPIAASVCLMLSAVMCIAATGCSRAFWRKQADRDVYRVLAEKQNDPSWALPRLDIQPDPRSRMFDPYDLDKGPLPPDDPAAHQYMQSMGGILGYKNWHKFGQTFSVENPQWLASFGLTEEMFDPDYDGSESKRPELHNLTLDQAIELSYIHSREYQTAIEDLYFEALDLTLERFQFGVRYLGIGGGEPRTTVTHESVPNGINNVTLDKRFGIGQLLPSGGQWVAELANNTVWMFTGKNSMNTASVISYSLVQPLLFGAGRKVVLEALTLAERRVLYQTRLLARFRKEFFVAIVSGGQSGGFLGILLQTQSVDNQRDNVRRLEEQVEVLRTLASQKPQEISENLPALPPGLQFPEQLAGQIRYDADRQQLTWHGPMSEEQAKILTELSDVAAFRVAVTELIQRLRTEVVTLDVAQLESQLAGSRIQLQQAEVRLQDILDRFKIELGLPPDLVVTVDEMMLEPFELIDPKLTEQEQRIKKFVEIWAKLDDDNPKMERLISVVNGLQKIQNSLKRDGIDLVQADFKRTTEYIGSEQFSKRPEEDRRRIARDVERDRRLFANIREEFEASLGRTGEMTSTLENPNLNGDQKKGIVRTIAEVREELLKISQSLQVIQIGQRVELITLEPFTMSQQGSVGVGMANRLDLENTLAAVMDSRRNLEVRANQLEAVLNIRVEGDIRTPRGVRPVNFRGDVSSYRAGIEFTAPLDQLRERNIYRAAQIDYQRARRSYMALEDNIKRGIRESWRQLTVLERNFELARQAVRIAALQLDSAVEQATAPPPVQAGASQQSGVQGRNLLNALRDVLNAQNVLIGIWVDYERSRLNIHRDMGIMEVDARGIWNDRFYQHPPNSETPDDEEQEIPPAPAVLNVDDQAGRLRAGRFDRKLGPMGETADGGPGFRPRLAPTSATEESHEPPDHDHSSGPFADGWRRHVPRNSSVIHTWRD